MLNPEYKPFEGTIEVTAVEWMEMPNSHSLIRLWNRKLGLIVKIIEPNRVIEYPSRLPYKTKERDASIYIVDKIYFDMLKDDGIVNLFK